MKGSDFLDKMEFIDDELIQNAELSGKSQKSKRFFQKWMAAAACICILIIGGATVNASSNGKLAQTIKQWFTGKELTDNIVMHKEEVYAKQTVFCNDNIAAFADELGIVIYDYNKEKVLGSINLQKIQCNNINAENIKTKFLSEDKKKLWIYNEKKGKPEGILYEFDLSNIEVSNKDEAKEILPVLGLNLDDKKTLSKLKQLKNNSSSYFVDSFSEIPIVKEKFNDGNWSYSEFAYVFKNKDNQDTACIMVVSDIKNKDKNTEICMYNMASGKYYTIPFNISVNEVKSKKLPYFKYNGSDEIMKAVCDYLCARDKSSNGVNHYGNAVYIPYPVILKVREKNNTIEVYGNFYSGYYELYGNQLNEMGGGEKPGVITFQRNKDNSLSFKEIKTAGDGDRYSKDIKKFSSWIPGLYHKFMDYDYISKQLKDIRIKMVRNYEETNNLGIEYIKDYGWDPVRIETKN
ncbi:hypothetical protein ACER0A_005535 [Haloimpatiens sp. FM7315]|uniref:hypothetical protein n=1 Tax=Haloimpatiens sp. FM7315 TaxID=3298609 RepID=UPI00370C5C6C